MYFAFSCGHCQKLAPIWDKLEAKLSSLQSSRVIIGSVDCTEERDLCSRESVMGFPTLKLYKSRESNGVEYEGERNLLSLETYLRTQLGDEAVDGTDESSEDKSRETLDESIDTPKPVNGLYELNNDNIEEFLSRGIVFGDQFAIDLTLLAHRSTLCQVLRPLVWPLSASGAHLGSIGRDFSIRHFCENI